MALPFLPHYEIRPMFVRLSVLAQTQPLRNLTDYIQEQWIESTVFTQKDWSVFKQPIRTNNDIEGWHNALNRRADGQCRLQFYLLIELLHREARLTSKNNQACFRQEVEENTEKEVQATPPETIRRLGAVPDRQ